MKTHLILIAAMLASGIAAASDKYLTLPPPPFFAEAMEYMHEHSIGDACVVLHVRDGKPSEIVIATSSGDAIFDALAVKGLQREIDELKRVPHDFRPADAAGWRRFPLKLHDKRHERVLGCAAKA